ncbi:MAG: DUF1272 domain-containing protein [Saprospiraceae bacterium]|nr:DUF1272 domain-containing protein [Saprospiraceae bacterium]
MLEIRPVCENCGKDLPNGTTDAMICSFECTFCLDCVTNILNNVCPNCGGGFEKRPIRRKSHLKKYPATRVKITRSVDIKKFDTIKKALETIPPEDR